MAIQEITDCPGLQWPKTTTRCIHGLLHVETSSASWAQGICNKPAKHLSVKSICDDLKLSLNPLVLFWDMFDVISRSHKNTMNRHFPLLGATKFSSPYPEHDAKKRLTVGSAPLERGYNWKWLLVQVRKLVTRLKSSNLGIRFEHRNHYLNSSLSSISFPILPFDLPWTLVEPPFLSQRQKTCFMKKHTLAESSSIDELEQLFID